MSLEREELVGLHYITHINNVPSIEEHGILSHDRAKRLQHYSIAMQEIQDRRVGKVVPNARPLHQYVNLYFCPRNPMMYKRRNEHMNLCILRINPDILDLPNVVITDRNASSDWARFLPSPGGLSEVDGELVFARNWYDNDTFSYWRKKSCKCAEVLVPDRVDQSNIIGAYVSCHFAEQNLQNTGSTFQCILCPDFFFQ